MLREGEGTPGWLGREGSALMIGRGPLVSEVDVLPVPTADPEPVVCTSSRLALSASLDSRSVMPVSVRSKGCRSG